MSERGVSEPGASDVTDPGPGNADKREWGDVGTTMLFENDRVRVWELRLEPGERSARHHHRHDYVMVQIEGDAISAVFEPDSGDAFGGPSMPDRTISGPVAPGTVVWGGAGGRETAVNDGSETFREIIVELK